jgi:hypothetical protein
VSLGFLFSGQVVEVVNWVEGFTGAAAGVAASLILGALVWRHVRARMHREPHRRMMVSGDVSGALVPLDADAA